MSIRCQTFVSLWPVLCGVIIGSGSAVWPGERQDKSQLYQRIESLSSDGSTLLLSEIWVPDTHARPASQTPVREWLVYSVNTQSGNSACVFRDRSESTLYDLPQWLLSKDGALAATFHQNKLHLACLNERLSRISSVPLEPDDTSVSYYPLVGLFGNRPCFFPLSRQKGVIALVGYKMKKPAPGRKLADSGIRLLLVSGSGKRWSQHVLYEISQDLFLANERWNFNCSLAPSEKWLAVMDHKLFMESPTEENVVPRALESDLRVRLWDLDKYVVRHEWLVAPKFPVAGVAWADSENALVFVEYYKREVFLRGFPLDGSEARHDLIRFRKGIFEMGGLTQSADGKYLLTFCVFDDSPVSLLIFDLERRLVLYKDLPRTRGSSHKVAMTRNRDIVVAYCGDLATMSDRDRELLGLRYPWRAFVVRYPVEAWQAWPVIAKW